MAMIADEVLKAEKCKELETKYGNVRKGLRMSLVAFLKDNPNYEKLVLLVLTQLIKKQNQSVIFLMI